MPADVKHTGVMYMNFRPELSYVVAILTEPSIEVADRPVKGDGIFGL